MTLLVAPNQGCLLWCNPGPFINHIIGEIKITGNLDLESFAKILIGIKLNTRQIFFQHYSSLSHYDGEEFGCPPAHRFHAMFHTGIEEKSIPLIQDDLIIV